MPSPNSTPIVDADTSPAASIDLNESGRPSLRDKEHAAVALPQLLSELDGAVKAYAAARAHIQSLDQLLRSIRGEICIARAVLAGEFDPVEYATGSAGAWPVNPDPSYRGYTLTDQGKAAIENAGAVS